MTWLSRLFGKKPSETLSTSAGKSKGPTLPPTPRTTAQPPSSPNPAQDQKEASIDSGDLKQVSDALSRFLKETEDGPRLEQVKILKDMGRRSLAPLLHEAFDEYGDPTRENIDIFKIRVAVWCGCALHPEEFDRYYRTKYQKGRTHMLDEMRAINMKDGINCETYVHELLASEKASVPNNSSQPASPPAATTETKTELSVTEKRLIEQQCSPESPADKLRVCSHDWSNGYKRCARCNITGYEACCIAIDNTDLEGVAYLLDKGLDPSKNRFVDGLVQASGLFPEFRRGEGPISERPLVYAVERGSVEALQAMVDHGAFLEGRYGKDSLLHIAVSCGRERVVAFLLSKGVPVQTKGDHGNTPLHLAPSASIAECLISKGADIHALADYDWTPLHVAAANCRTDVVKALLTHGANRSAKDSKGNTPHATAISFGQYKTGQKETLELLK